MIRVRALPRPERLRGPELRAGAFEFADQSRCGLAATFDQRSD
jgi:hypothetical protein